MEKLGASYASTTADPSDPETCGEDLNANLNLAVELAPIHCVECNGQHFRYAVTRLIKPRSNSDRLDLVALLAAAVGPIAAERDGVIDICIAGAADTGILANCAHAFSFRPDVACRLRYVVIDICETPLALCREYGARHGLDIVTERMDLREPRKVGDCDIVILHSFLTQIPPDLHVPLLLSLRAWLRPSGRILLANRLDRPPAEPKQERIELLRQRAQRGEINLPVSIDEIAAALVIRDSWEFEFRHADDLRTLLRTSGFEIENEIERQRAPRQLPRYSATAVKTGEAPA